MTQIQPATIAIIGGGFSGAMVAAHLLRSATQPLTLFLIERQSTVGQGIAYSTPFDCHLLNVPAGKMSAFAQEPTHFLEWLHHHPWGMAAGVDATTFVPRRLFGEYIQAVLADAEAEASSGVCLKRLNDEAIACELENHRCKIRLLSGTRLNVDRVVLALGTFPPGNPAVTNPLFYQSDRYIQSPWAALARLQKVDPNESILLIGSGLTMLDLVVALHQQGHQGPIQVVSRRGLLPQAHQAAQVYSMASQPRPKTMRALVRWVRQLTEAAVAEGYDWRSVVDALRPEIQTLWQALSITEQRRFLRHVQPYWEVHRHRVAPAIAQVATQLLNSQQLQVHAGRIQEYCEDAGGVTVLLRRRGSRELTSVRAGLVVNCTGPTCDYHKSHHPLILGLLGSGLGRSHPLNLGLDVSETGALITAEGQSQHFYTLGSVQKGRLWETTAVPEIRQQAQALAQTLLQSLSHLNQSYASVWHTLEQVKFPQSRQKVAVFMSRSTELNQSKPL